MAKPKAKAKAKAKATAMPKASGKRKPKANAKPKASAKATRPATAPVTASHERFARAAYDLPVMDLAEAVALATALLASRPSKSAPSVVEEAKRVTAARDRARAVQKDGSGSVDARAYDVAMDRAWATFVRRVQDHVELPAARRTDAADVARIYGIVSDLSILKLNYLAEFAQIGARLDSLKREGLLEVARTLVGTAFVDEVLFCHGEYGQALGITAAPSVNANAVIDRGEARLALVDAIAEYAVQVMAQARAGRSESWAPVAKALGPIAELRSGQQRAHRAPPVAPPRAPHPPVERTPRAEPAPPT